MSTYLNNSFDAAGYSKFRPTYPEDLYRYIDQYHETNSNVPINVAIDLACGTGQATLALRSIAKNVVGVDHSETMVSQAREYAKETGIEFRVARDSDLTSIAALGSVDLLNAAEGAHYFTYPEFWYQAAKVLKPGGTLSLFAYWTFGVPEHPKIAKIIDDYANITCGPYFDEGWGIVSGGYAQLRESIPTDLFENIEYRVNLADEFKKNEPFELTKSQVPLGMIISLLKTWAAYFMYMRKNPGSPDIADVVMDQITAQTGLTAGDKVNVKWNTTYLLATRKMG